MLSDDPPGPDGQTLLNLSFSAACHPLICTTGDEILPALRSLCRGSRVAADAGRKRLQVILPARPSEQHPPQPRDLASLLLRLPALSHVTICQDDAPDLLDPPPRPPSDGPAPLQQALPQPATTVPRHQQQHERERVARPPRPPPRRPAPARLLWQTALRALRPQHLRSLELHGLVVTVRQLTHGSAGGAVANGIVSPGRRRPHAAPPTGQSSTLELLSRLLVGAPGLQELALLGVTMAALPSGDEAGSDEEEEEEEQDAEVDARAHAGSVTARGHMTAGRVAAAAHGCDDCGDGGGSGSGSSAAAGWCAVLRALPASLTSLRLGLDRPSHPHGPAGGAGCQAEQQQQQQQQQQQPHTHHHHHHQPCAACLGAALRRLLRLSSLELSGVRAGTALAALQLAAAPLAPPPLRDLNWNPAPQQPQQQPQHQPQQQPQQRQQTPQQGQGQGQAAATSVALALLENLVLDIEGHMRMEALRDVLTTGLPRLRHLIVVEQRAPPRAPPPPPPPAAWPRIAPKGTAAAATVAAAAMTARGEGEGVELGLGREGDETQFSPLGSVLWMLHRRELRRLSFTTDRSFTTLGPQQPSPPAAATAQGGGEQADGGDGDGDSCCRLSSVRLSLDLSAEALEPLVVALPPSLTSLTLNVGTLHRPSDVLAAYAAANDAARGANGAGGAAAAAPTAPPPPLPPTAALDSPAWLSVPPHSFLGGMRFLWPALTALPRVVPALRELRLGGGAAVGCSDHVLRCWAGASGHPDSLATPMVVDPSFNAMVRHQNQPRNQAQIQIEIQRQRVPQPSPPVGSPVEPLPGHVRSQRGGQAGQQQAGQQQAGQRQAGQQQAGQHVARQGAHRNGQRSLPPSFYGTDGGGGGGGGGDDGYEAAGAGSAATSSGTVGGAEAAAGAGAGAAGAGEPAMGWSDWSHSLERVCLMAQGPTVAGALHLRRFMGGLRRLQLVVDGRLTDVALAPVGGGAGTGGLR